MKKHYVTISVAVVCAAIFFFIGDAVGKNSAVSGNNSVRGVFASSTRGGFVGRNGGGFAAGQIIAIDQNSMTVQLPNGNSEIVFYSSSTQVVKLEPQTEPVSSLTPGTQVMIGGTQNSDGSVTAQTIQIRAAGTSTGVFGSGR